MILDDGIDESEIGKRIKALRVAKGLTLEKLARQTDFTKGYLSKVEKSQKPPPISTLWSIARALGTTISSLIGETPQTSRISHIKKGKRPVIAKDSTQFGYAYESIAHRYPNRSMEPYILTIPPKLKTQMVFRHEGEEILFVLKGTMQFNYGDEQLICEEGDCIYFDSSIPHYGVAYQCEQAQCLMVIYPSKNGKDTVNAQ